MVVNRNNTANKVSFGGINSGADIIISNGLLDVSALGISLTGGNTDSDLASIFNTSSNGNFRINKFVFQLTDLSGKSASLKTLTNSDYADGHDFKIFPNPAIDNITVQLPKEKNIQINIYNSLGVDIYNENVSASKSNGNKIKINLQNSKPGIYFIKINDGENISTKKIIKK